jgi:uncharacterized protein YbbK (DUF523 family)
MKPRIGVSACLLGEKVRYDGAGKRQPWAEDAFAGRVEWLPVCPEVELGLGVPRETVQLEVAGGVRLMTTETRRDLTSAMREWAAECVERLTAAGLDGYVFKARSPSCGLGSTPVAGVGWTRDGLFAEAVRKRFPELPLTDEETLRDPLERERFLQLVETHRNLRSGPAR